MKMMEKNLPKSIYNLFASCDVDDSGNDRWGRAHVNWISLMDSDHQSFADAICGLSVEFAHL